MSPRLIRPVTGEHQGRLSLVTEYDDWGAFAAAVEKVQASSEYQALMQSAGQTAEPAIDSLSTEFYTEV